MQYSFFYIIFMRISESEEDQSVKSDVVYGNMINDDTSSDAIDLDSIPSSIIISRRFDKWSASL